MSAKLNKRKPQFSVFERIAVLICDSGGTRTPNLLGRNQVLYPIKLRNLVL